MAHPTLLVRLNPIDQDEVNRSVADAAFDELPGVIMSDCMNAGTTTASGNGRGQLRKRRTASRSWWGATVVGAAAATVVLLMIVGQMTPPPSDPPFTTSWSASRPLQSAGGAHERHGTWRLLDDLLAGDWTQNINGPPSGTATCPTSQECYKLAGTYASSGADARLVSLSLYVSTNVGASWSSLPVPSGFEPTSTLACGSSMWCVAGGIYDGEAALLSTANGGHSFTIGVLPAGLGKLYRLSCPAAATCIGLMATQKRTRGGTSKPGKNTLLTIHDGGKAFTERPLNENGVIATIGCTSSVDCTVVGLERGSLQARPSRSFVAMTSDGGVSWHLGSLPIGFDISTTSQLSCSNATECSVVGEVPIVNSLPKCTSGGVGLSAAMSQTVASISAVESKLVDKALAGRGTCSPSEVTDIARTSNGGRTWTPEQLPLSVPNPLIYGISCPTAAECWVAGQYLGARQVGNVSTQAQPMLLGTTDGGHAWAKVSFSVPPTAPDPTGQSYLSMSSIACPTATVCLATGAAAAGAPHSPSYAFTSGTAKR